MCLIACVRSTLQKVGEFLSFTQSLAALEILHSMIGIVPSPVATVAMQVPSLSLSSPHFVRALFASRSVCVCAQVFSRLLLVHGITNPVAESRPHWGYALM
jgi:hypothetical protein